MSAEVKCYACQGAGKVFDYQDENGKTHLKACTTCAGAGWIITSDGDE